MGFMTFLNTFTDILVDMRTSLLFLNMADLQREDLD